MSLQPWYVTGLTEGEGCFSISFNFKRKLKIGIETRPSFSISLNQRDLSLLKQVHSYFNCGAIRFSRNDRTYKFEVRSVKDLVKKVITHFVEYPLVGNKQNDLQIFKEICEKIHVNFHLNAKHLAEIIKMAYQMNPSGKRKLEINELLRLLGEKMV